MYGRSSYTTPGATRSVRLDSRFGMVIDRSGWGRWALSAPRLGSDGDQVMRTIDEVGKDLCEKGLALRSIGKKARVLTAGRFKKVSWSMQGNGEDAFLSVVELAQQVQDMVDALWMYALIESRQRSEAMEYVMDAVKKPVKEFLRAERLVRQVGG